MRLLIIENNEKLCHLLSLSTERIFQRSFIPGAATSRKMIDDSTVGLRDVSSAPRGFQGEDHMVSRGYRGFRGGLNGLRSASGGLRDFPVGPKMVSADSGSYMGLMALQGPQGLSRKKGGFQKAIGYFWGS